MFKKTEFALIRGILSTICFSFYASPHIETIYIKDVRIENTAKVKKAVHIRNGLPHYNI